LIPENQKLFFDVLVKNANLINPALAKDIGILFTEVLKDGKIHFEPKIEKQGNLSSYFGHETYECENAEDLKRLKSTIAWNLITSNFE